MINETKKNLIAVQGATEFIAGYIACRWCEEKIWFEENDITLLIYDTCVPVENEILFQKTIREIANIVNIQKIIFINQLDARKISKNHYSKSILSLKKIIGEEDFDYLFAARDYGSFITELLPNVYPKSLKIEYGDAFGLVGNEKYLKFTFSEILKKPLNYFKTVSKKILYGHYHKKFPFEFSVLTMPLVWDSNYLIRKKLLIPDMDFVKKIFYDISSQLIELSKYCESLIATSECNVYLLSNLHNSGGCTYENEITLYEDIILRTAISGQRIILKNHPRGSDEMLLQLKNRLSKKFDVKLIDDKKYSFIPIELWGIIMNNCNVFPVYSTSSISLKYLYGKSVVLILNENMVNKYIYTDKQKFVIDGVDMIQKAIDKLENWDFSSPLWTKSLSNS